MLSLRTEMVTVSPDIFDLDPDDHGGLQLPPDDVAFPPDGGGCSTGYRAWVVFLWQNGAKDQQQYNMMFSF